MCVCCKLECILTHKRKKKRENWSCFELTFILHFPYPGYSAGYSLARVEIPVYIHIVTGFAEHFPPSTFESHYHSTRKFDTVWLKIF